MIPTGYYVLLSAALFTLGVLGVLIRRNALIVFMSVELMLNSATLALRHHRRRRRGRGRPGAAGDDLPQQADDRRRRDSDLEGVTFERSNV